MAAPAVRGGGSVCHRACFLTALAFLAALCAAPATRPACAAEERKVWRALTEEDRRGRRPPAAPNARGNSITQVSRDPASTFVVAGIVVAVLVGIVVALLPLARRRRSRPAPAKPRSAKMEAANEIEQFWRDHLSWKRRKRNPTA